MATYDPNAVPDPTTDGTFGTTTPAPAATPVDPGMLMQKRLGGDITVATPDDQTPYDMFGVGPNAGQAPAATGAAPTGQVDPAALEAIRAKYRPGQAPAEDDVGIGTYLRLAGNVGLDVLQGAVGGTAEALQQVFGGEVGVGEQADLLDTIAGLGINDYEDVNDTPALAQKVFGPGKLADSIANLGISMGISLPATIAAIGTGVISGVTSLNPVVGAIAGGATGAGYMHAQKKGSTMRQIMSAVQADTGLPLTAAEQAELRRQYEEVTTKAGLNEVGPEFIANTVLGLITSRIPGLMAAGNLSKAATAMAKMKALNKSIPNLAKTAAKVAGAQLPVEIATETATEVLDRKALANTPIGSPEEAQAGIMDAAGEVALPTILQTLLSGGLATGATALANRGRGGQAPAPAPGAPPAPMTDQQRADFVGPQQPFVGPPAPEIQTPQGFVGPPTPERILAQREAGQMGDYIPEPAPTTTPAPLTRTTSQFGAPVQPAPQEQVLSPEQLPEEATVESRALVPVGQVVPASGRRTDFVVLENGQAAKVGQKISSTEFRPQINSALDSMRDAGNLVAGTFVHIPGVGSYQVTKQDVSRAQTRAAQTDQAGAMVPFEQSQPVMDETFIAESLELSAEQARDYARENLPTEAVAIIAENPQAFGVGDFISLPTAGETVQVTPAMLDVARGFKERGIAVTAPQVDAQQATQQAAANLGQRNAEQQMADLQAAGVSPDQMMAMNIANDLMSGVGPRPQYQVGRAVSMPDGSTVMVTQKHMDDARRAVIATQHGTQQAALPAGGVIFGQAPDVVDAQIADQEAKGLMVIPQEGLTTQQITQARDRVQNAGEVLTKDGITVESFDSNIAARYGGFNSKAILDEINAKTARLEEIKFPIGKNMEEKQALANEINVLNGLLESFMTPDQRKKSAARLGKATQQAGQQAQERQAQTEAAAQERAQARTAEREAQKARKEGKALFDTLKGEGFNRSRPANTDNIRMTQSKDGKTRRVTFTKDYTLISDETVDTPTAVQKRAQTQAEAEAQRTAAQREAEQEIDQNVAAQERQERLALQQQLYDENVSDLGFTLSELQDDTTAETLETMEEDLEETENSVENEDRFFEPGNEKILQDVTAANKEVKSVLATIRNVYETTMETLRATPAQAAALEARKLQGELDNMGVKTKPEDRYRVLGQLMAYKERANPRKKADPTSEGRGVGTDRPFSIGDDTQTKSYVEGVSDAPLSDQEAVQQLNNYLEAEGRRANIKAENPQSVWADDARAIAAAFGKRVVFFSGGGRIRGSIGQTVGTRDVVFIHVGNRSGSRAIVGHELMHMLRKEHPDAYYHILETLQANMNEGNFTKEQQKLLERYRRGGVDLSQDKAMEEMLADVAGELMMTNKFWYDLGVNIDNVSTFQRVVQAVMDVINSIRQTILGGGMGANANAIVKDMNAMSKAISNGYLQFLGSKDMSAQLEAGFARFAGGRIDHKMATDNFEVNDQNILRPVIQTVDRRYAGYPGTHHLTSDETGFVTPDGTYLNKYEAYEWMKENDPDNFTVYDALTKEDGVNWLDTTYYNGAKGFESAEWSFAVAKGSTVRNVQLTAAKIKSFLSGQKNFAPGANTHIARLSLADFIALSVKTEEKASFNDAILAGRVNTDIDFNAYDTDTTPNGVFSLTVDISDPKNPVVIAATGRENALKMGKRSTPSVPVVIATVKTTYPPRRSVPTSEDIGAEEKFITPDPIISVEKSDTLPAGIVGLEHVDLPSRGPKVMISKINTAPINNDNRAIIEGFATGATLTPKTQQMLQSKAQQLFGKSYANLSTMEQNRVKAVVAQYNAPGAAMDEYEQRMFSISSSTMDLGGDVADVASNLYHMIKNSIIGTADAATRPGQTWYNLKTMLGRTAMHAMPLRSMSDAYGYLFRKVGYENNQSPIKVFEDIVKKVTRTRNDLSDKLGQIIEPIKNKKESRDRISEAALTNSFNQVDARLPLNEQEWVGADGDMAIAEQGWIDAGMKEATASDEFPAGMTLKQAYDEARAAYVKLNQQERQIFDELANHLKNLRTQHRDAYINRTYDLATKQIEAELENLKSTLTAAGLSNAAADAQVLAVKNYRRTREKGSADIDLTTIEGLDEGVQEVAMKSVNRVKRLTNARISEISKAKALFKQTRGVYFPLARFGQFTAERGEGNRREYSQFETAAERDRFIQKENEKNRAKIAKGKVKAWGKGISVINRQSKGSPKNDYEFMTKVGNAIKETAQEQLDDINKDETLTDDQKNDMTAAISNHLEDSLTNMHELWLTSLPQTSALKNAIKRGNVRGYSKDVIRAMADYTTRHASNIAFMQHGYKMDLEVSAAQRFLDGYAKANQGENIDLQKHVLNHLRDRSESIRSAARSNAFGKLASSASTVWFMSSPSAYLVQLSQIGSITMPRLMSIYKSPARVTKALGKAVRQSMGKEVELKELNNDPDVTRVAGMFDELVTPAMVEAGSHPDKNVGDFVYDKETIHAEYMKLDEKQRRKLIIKKAVDEGIIDITLAAETVREASATNDAGITSLAATFMKAGEVGSRKIAMLAGVDLALSEGRANNIVEAYSEGRDLVDATIYNYAMEAKPPALQKHAWLRIATQFQYYRINTLARMLNQFHRGYMSRDSGYTPQEKQEARSELNWMMGMSTAMAGVVGTPIAGALFMLSDFMRWMLGEDDEEMIDTEADFKKMAGDLVSYGPIGAFFGANVSRRIGTRDIIPGLGMGAPSYLHGEDLMAYYATSLMGPSYQVTADISSGFEKFSEGRYLDGAVEMMPKGVRDIAKSIKVGTEGVKDARGLRIGEDLDNWDLFLMAAGFNPLDYSKPREVQGRVGAISERLSRKKGILTSKMARAYVENDTDTKEEALEEIIEWNKSHPNYPIDGSTLGQSVRRKMIMDRGYVAKNEYLIRRDIDEKLK